MLRSNKPKIGSWVMTLTAILLLAVSCIASVLVVFGGTGMRHATNFEASSLADAEVTELIGTESYTKSDVPKTHSVFNAIAQGLHIPFSNPVQMMTAELPETADTISDKTTTQSSLFSFITTWAANSGKLTIGWATDGSAWTTEHVLTNNPGVNVLCPTWMTLSSPSGTVSNHIQESVIDFAHKRHVQVWALIDNQFSRKLTRQVLENKMSVQTLVSQIKQVALDKKLDGINVDFENIDPKDRDNFTYFIAALHTALSPNHIDLSVDITPDIVMLNDDAEFFHAGLATYCDQIILMAYDEHWSTDPTPGPVADVPWVTNSVYDLVDTGVPTDKLILGIPFYARFWHIHDKGAVTSESVGSGAVDGILKSHHVTGKWDNNLGVMYTKYPKSDGYEEVWYETNETMARKLKLVNDAGLGGVAVWTLQLSNTQTWTNFIESLRQSVS